MRPCIIDLRKPRRHIRAPAIRYGTEIPRTKQVDAPAGTLVNLKRHRPNGLRIPMLHRSIPPTSAHSPKRPFGQLGS